MIGYEFLLSQIDTSLMPLQQPTRIKPVTRVVSMPDLLAIPRHVAPADDSILSHVLFALRYVPPAPDSMMTLMDGNGRISRLLAHHTLNVKGILPNKTINLLIH